MNVRILGGTSGDNERSRGLRSVFMCTVKGLAHAGNVSAVRGALSGLQEQTVRVFMDCLAKDVPLSQERT